MFETLSKIGEKLNEGRVLWGVGGSILLSNYGLVDNPNDIDILVSINDIEKVDLILSNIGEKKLWEKIDTYSTKYFYEYVVNGIDIDVMAGLRINHSEGIYRHVFDDESNLQSIEINRISIPLCSLEDWYVIYQLIPNKEFKAKLIENYLLSNEIKHLNLLKRALRGNLPGLVRDNIQRLLNS